MRKRAGWLATAAATAVILVGGVVLAQAAMAPDEPDAAAPAAVVGLDLDDVTLDLGALNLEEALASCATTAFVDGDPGSVELLYGQQQLTPTTPTGSFVLRNGDGKVMFCDMFGEDCPAVLPLPTTSATRPAVMLTNNRRHVTCAKAAGVELAQVRTNLWLAVTDQVESARTRFLGRRGAGTVVRRRTAGRLPAPAELAARGTGHAARSSSRPRCSTGPATRSPSPGCRAARAPCSSAAASSSAETAPHSARAGLAACCAGNTPHETSHDAANRRADPRHGRETQGAVMGLGVGIFLVVLGLIFVLDVINVDLPGIEDNTLGLILLVAGIAGIVLGMIASRNARRTVVEERRVE